MKILIQQLYNLTTTKFITMFIHRTILTFCLLLMSAIVSLQAQKKAGSAANTNSSAGGTKTTQQQFDDDLATAKAAKEKLDSALKIFHSKPLQEVTISVSNIDFDNKDFEKLTNTIKSMKAVKKMSTGYADNIGTITLNLKGDDGTALWRSLPEEIRAPFKVSKVLPDQIIAEYVPIKSLSQNTPSQN